MTSEAVRVGLVEAVGQLRADLGDEIAQELCGLFLKNTPELLKAMHDGLTNGDARAVGRAAHELKSTAATLGANELARACADLEARAAKEPAAALAPRIDAARASFADARDVLETMFPAP